ncbi:MAG TPA: hypothetical protein DIT13_15505, partial [Verrucomicrobiales bacterium]|nr:hypothetical protein [Verrucomicrobiales bacterium]
TVRIQDEYSWKNSPPASASAATAFPRRNSPPCSTPAIRWATSPPSSALLRLLRLLRPYLMRRGELLDFYHGQFREAANKAYLTTDHIQRTTRLRMVDYFILGLLPRQQCLPQWFLEGSWRLSACSPTMLTTTFGRTVTQERTRLQWQ